MLALLASQIVMALILLPLIKVDDFYPYFKWNLFRAQQKITTLPMIYIAHANEKRFSPPVSYHEYFTKIEPNLYPGKTTRAHDSLWDYVNSKDPGQKNLIRQNIERFLFSKLQFVEYKIVMVEIEKMEFYETFNIRSRHWESESYIMRGP